MSVLIIAKIICLVFAVWFGTVNAIKTIYKADIPAFNVFIMSIAIVGFVVIQFGLYK